MKQSNTTINKIKRTLLRGLTQAEVDGNAVAMASVSRALLDVEAQLAEAAAGGETPSRSLGDGAGTVTIQRVVIDHGASWTQHLTAKERRQLDALRRSAERRSQGRPATASEGPAAAPSPPAAAAPRVLDDDDGRPVEEVWVDHEVVGPGETRPARADAAATRDLLFGVARAQRGRR